MATVSSKGEMTSSKRHYTVELYLDNIGAVSAVLRLDDGRFNERDIENGFDVASEDLRPSTFTTVRIHQNQKTTRALWARLEGEGVERRGGGR